TAPAAAVTMWVSLRQTWRRPAVWWCRGCACRPSVAPSDRDELGLLPESRSASLLFVQDIGHAHGAYKPPRDSMSRTLLSLAGFQVIITGRFWVIAEAFCQGEHFATLPQAESVMPSIHIGKREHYMRVRISTAHSYSVLVVFNACQD